MATKETPKNPERMQRLFEAVKQLKRENYIGTARAWASITVREGFGKNAKEISDNINSRLEQQVKSGKLPAITYQATPERIVGILEGMFQITKISEKMVRNYKNTCGTRAPDSIFILDIHVVSESAFGFRFSNHPILTLGGDSMPLLSSPDLNYLSRRSDYSRIANQKAASIKIAKTLFPIFLMAQSNAKTDDEFGAFATKCLFDIFPLNNNDRDLVKKAIGSIDFNALLSLKNMQDMELSLGRLYANPELKINAVFRDGVDHRLEIRREILADHLLKLVDDYGIGITYEQVLKKTFDRFKYLDRKPKFEGVGLRNAKYILHLVKTEKPFIEKFLRS